MKPFFPRVLVRVSWSIAGHCCLRRKYAGWSQYNTKLTKTPK